MHEVVIMAFSYNTLCINKKAAVKKPNTFDIKLSSFQHQRTSLLGKALKPCNYSPFLIFSGVLSSYSINESIFHFKSIVNTAYFFLLYLQLIGKAADRQTLQNIRQRAEANDCTHSCTGNITSIAGKIRRLLQKIESAGRSEQSEHISQYQQCHL